MTSINVDLLTRLPLPLAQLYRRAANAKTAQERHLSAFYLWEAALKLLGCTAVAVYASQRCHDASLVERLQNLARPSLGHWWEFVRLLTAALADGGDPGFWGVRDLVLGKTRDDLARLAGLDAVLLEVLDGKPGVRSTVRLTELFDRLVRYRNGEIGHGAIGHRPAAFHERLGQVLLAGVPQLLERLDVLAGRRLVYIDDVRLLPSGRWLVERYELKGETASRMTSLDLPDDEATRRLRPLPQRVYLDGGNPVPVEGEGPTSLVSLHPLVYHDPEADETFFLNARRGRTRIELLSYTTGRSLDRADLPGAHQELLAHLLDLPVSGEDLAAWAERSRAEEPAPREGEASAEPAPPRRLGEFELLSELGRGGMGVVYRAWQPSLSRQVALKVLFRSGDPKAEARFAREIRALGKVEHPHLVKVYTSGSEGEQWFFAMELIEGAPLDQVCARLRADSNRPDTVDGAAWQHAVQTVCAEARRQEKALTAREGEAPAEPATSPADEVRVRGGRAYVRQVVELVRQVAEAAHALHERGIIHRDIKPGNLLLSEEGRPVLMDLGLAQLSDEVEGRLTKTRQFVGTLRYASPEQVLAAGKLDRRVDVYSLGATLWELLTLRPLFGATEQTPTPELMNRILVEEPESPRKYHRGLSRDLEAIVQRCLEKDARKRYATAAELARDLNRYLDGEPVRARPVRSWERGWKWVRRHPVAAGLAGATTLLVLVLVAGVVGLVYHREVQTARQKAINALDQAQKAKAKTEDALGEAQKAKEAADQAKQEEENQRKIADEQRRKAEKEVERADKQLYYGQVQQALLKWKYEGVVEAQNQLDQCRRDLHGWEFAYVQKLCVGSDLTLKGHAAVVRSVCFSPDGKRLASASDDQTVKVWDAQTGQEVSLKKHTGKVCSVCFSPDGKQIASGSDDQLVKVWDAQTGQEAFSLKFGGPEFGTSGEAVYSVCFSPDSKRLALARQGKTVKVWDAQTGEEAITLQGHQGEVYSVSFSPDGKRIASASEDKTVKVWDADKGQEVLSLKGHTDRVTSVTFSPDGKRLASASNDQTVKVWDADNGTEILSLKGHTKEVTSVCFSPDGKRLASASRDWTVKVWNARKGGEILSFKGHTKEVTSICFSPDGTRIASASSDQTVKVWDGVTGQQIFDEGATPFPATSVCFSPDGKHLAHSVFKYIYIATVKVCDGKPARTVHSLKEHTRHVISVSFSPVGNRLASASLDGTVKVWDTQTGQKTLSLKGKAAVFTSVCFSPDGKRLASASDDGTVMVWDAQTGQEALPLRGHTDVVNGVSFSPDGKRLASASEDGTVKVWEALTGQEAITLQGHQGAVCSVSFSPDGKRLASASEDGTVKVWDAQTGQEALSLKGHTKAVFSVCFSPDGKRLASASIDKTVKVWDAQTGQEAITLQGHQGPVFSVRFSPDGKCLASASEDGTVKVWDAQICQESPSKVSLPEGR